MKKLKNILLGALGVIALMIFLIIVLLTFAPPQENHSLGGLNAWKSTKE